MGKIPEEAVKAALDTWLDHEFDGTLNYPRMRNALTAALHFLPVQVAVKKLEWEKHTEKEEWYGGTQNELVGVNEYNIFAHPCATGLFVLDVMGNRCDDDFASLEAAKAAAQADYEARIRSAIETVISVSEPSAARELALEEAAKNCEREAAEVEGLIDDVAYHLRKRAAAIRTLSSPGHADAGKLVEGDGWLPIESAPKDGTEILAWRKDCGQFIASYTSCSAFPMSEAELDLLDEETLFKEDWFTQWPQALRLEGSEAPTHWRPLPSAPSQEVAGS